MKIKRLISICLALLMIISAFSYTAMANDINPKPVYEIAGNVIADKHNPDDEVTFIVEVDGDPVLAGAEAASLGTDYIDTDDGQIKENAILKAQANVINSINDSISEDIKVEAVYTLLFNGFAIKAAYGDMEKIKNIDGVNNVYISEDIEIKPHLTDTADIIGTTLEGISDYTGKGQLVAIIDTEFDTSHEFFETAPIDPKYSTDDDMAKLLEGKTLSTSGVPYSPRVQGAGIVNAAAAVKTPVILLGNSGKAKISLGDGLESSFDISFTAQNIGSDDVTYDKITLNVLTDGYTLNGGKYYVSDSVNISVTSHTLPDSITVKKGESTAIDAAINLDLDELDGISQIFTNGFFIDGFIRLEKEDASIPSVGIPFTGFYGDWTKAPVFDSTIYDEGGSTLVSDANGVGSTLLYTTVSGSSSVLGCNGAGGYDSGHIALSPNGDGLHDEIMLQLTPMRTISKLTSTVTDESGNTEYLTASLSMVFNKFNTRNIGLNDISTLEDGDYNLRLDALYNYQSESPTLHTLEIPFYVDTEVPEIIKAVPNGDTISVTFRDNRNVSYVYTYYEDASGTVHYDKKYIQNYVAGTDVIVSFDLGDISAQDAPYEDIYIFVHDSAENYYANSLSCVTGDVHPLMTAFTYENSVLSVNFDIISYKPQQNCAMVLAFYDGSGRLVYLKAKEDVSLANGSSSHSFADFADLSEAKECRLFIWDDLNTISPADTSKSFNVSAELGLN